MDAIIKTGCFKGDKLSTIGICRKFKAVHMISCLVRCDCREVRQEVLDKHEGLSKRQFPEERPTPKMLDTWRRAIACVATSTVNGKMCLQDHLGRFLLSPLRHINWYASRDQTNLYHNVGQGRFTAHSKSLNASRRQTKKHTQKICRDGLNIGERS